MRSAWQHARDVGRKFYETGVLCKNGHFAPRYTVGGACTLCSVARIKAHYAAAKGTPKEKERCRLKALRQRAETPEKLNERTRLWRVKNPNSGSDYRLANLAYYAERAQARRAGLKTATPVWSEKLCILSLYNIADSLRTAGADVQVDHIAPLKGKIVSGLHVRNNLRIIHSVENQSKNNRFEAMA